MGRLIYSMITSVDGYVSGPDGGFDWALDSQLHDFITTQFADVGTYLYGRRMYETMVYWETAHLEPDQEQAGIDYAKVWQAAEKVVFSRTLAEVSSERTRIEREFDPATIERWKAESDRDFTVDGPTLAAEAMRAGLVDEFGLFIGPGVAGGGRRFFPDGVSVELELAEDRRFDSGVMFLRYEVVRR
ncbi:dihydrofolate reductase family protein [Microbacterium sp. 3J1]|uniref:dihydrofolate reductase family protein n=1 Tax=Microbacterium sp. 3J1 TaxID=861269 RepID=UPI000B0C125D|nr:dihydrofolate reductase family protein [Microbacterium sp. 3J1]